MARKYRKTINATPEEIQIKINIMDNKITDLKEEIGNLKAERAKLLRDMKTIQTRIEKLKFEKEAKNMIKFIQENNITIDQLENLINNKS